MTTQVDVYEVARGLAAELEGDWEVSPGHSSDRDVFVRSGTGEGLHISTVDSKARLSISGEHGKPGEDLYSFWPRDTRTCNTVGHTITVSTDKNPTQVARDVSRRLLPGYRDALAQARAAKATHTAREAAAGQLAREIAAVLGGTVAAHAPHTPHTVRVGAQGGDLRGTAQITRNHVVFELRVPLDLGVAFARRVAGA